MIKQLGGLLLLALIGFWDTPPASAAFITVLDDNGNIFTDKTDDPSEIDFDIEWINNEPVWLQIALIPDSSTAVFFSSEHTNNTPQLWSDFHVDLEGGAVWSAINGVMPTPSNVNSTLTSVSLFFDPTTFVNIGLAGAPDATDWVIDVSGVQNFVFEMRLQPSTTVMETTVPEPSTFVLLGIGGLALVGYGWRHKRQAA